MKFVFTMHSLQPADEEAAAHFSRMQEGEELVLQEYKPNQRTKKQNASLWKYCTLLAEALNDAGLDMLTFPYRNPLQIPWTKTSIMETFWRPIQDAMYDKESTTELNTVDIQKVYQSMDRAIAERTGVRVDWPCKDSQVALGDRRAA